MRVLDYFKKLPFATIRHPTKTTSSTFLYTLEHKSALVLPTQRQLFHHKPKLNAQKILLDRCFSQTSILMNHNRCCESFLESNVFYTIVIAFFNGQEVQHLSRQDLYVSFLHRLHTSQLRQSVAGHP